MSESVIEHPITLIDSLLKMGKGDKGRLLYLKKALIDGKTIYDSDKKYLKQMDKILSNKKIFKNKPNIFKDKKENNLKPQRILKLKTSNFNKISITGYDQNENDNFDYEIQSIQTLIDDIRTKDSQIKNNLELLLVNREIYSDDLEENSTFLDLSNSVKSSSSGFFVPFNHPGTVKQFNFSGLKKHDFMAYAAAGLFSLGFVSYMNLRYLGSLKGLILGLSAGSAVAAGLFFKRAKKDN